MKERPIIMSAESVISLLAREKNQTRRVVNPQPLVAGAQGFTTKHPDHYCFYMSSVVPLTFFWLKCPYGLAGDHLWVRETRWRNGGYVATDEPKLEHDGKVPSIFMPKIMARIWLEIADIRAERLLDITQTDAAAEGFGCSPAGKGDFIEPYLLVWNQYNEKRGFSWRSNPHVWVVEFNVLDRSDRR